VNESLMLIPDTIARAACAAERERCVSQLVALANQMHAEAQGHTWVDPETAQGNDLAAMCVQFAMERAIIALREVRGFANQARATRIHRARSVQPAENERLREACREAMEITNCKMFEHVHAKIAAALSTVPLEGNKDAE